MAEGCLADQGLLDRSPALVSWSQLSHYLTEALVDLRPLWTSDSPFVI